MTSQTGKQTIAIHILPNISRSKGNQAMKTGQLIEYNMRNIFLEKPYTKRVGETIPRLFPKLSKLSISLDNCLKFYTVCFYCMPRWGLSKLLKLGCRPLAFTSYNAFLKNKKEFGTSFPASFSAWFWRKHFSCYILLTDQISFSGCLYFVRYCAICIL